MNLGAPPRRPPFFADAMVLELLGETRHALSAHEVARTLSATGSSLAPMQAYRALSRLVKKGCVARIEGLNAYCRCPDNSGPLVYCRCCRRIAASSRNVMVGELSASARRSGFSARRVVAEISGICPACQRDKTGGAR